LLDVLGNQQLQQHNQNQQIQQQQQQYQNINPNIHAGSIPSTGRSTYAGGASNGNNFQTIINNTTTDKSVEDTRMIIEQSNRMIKNGPAGNITIIGAPDDKTVMLPATSYIDQPMLSAMQQMFQNANHPQQQQQQQQQQHQQQQQQQQQQLKTIYHQPNTQIYFN